MTRSTLTTGVTMLDAEADTRFWLRHVRLGNWLNLAVLIIVALYLATTPDGANRPVMWLLFALSTITSAAGAFFPWRRLFDRGAGEELLLAWSVAVVLFIIVGIAVDDPTNSPLQVLLVLPIVFAAMAYRPTYVVLLGCIVVAGRVGVSTLLGSFAGDAAVLRSGALIVIATMCVLIAKGHREQHEKLAEAAGLLHELAHLDVLTGCDNRRAFEDQLQTMVSTAEPLGLLLFDIDDFKRVNDAHGHLAGDALLVRAADLIRRHVRRGDVVARIGGDEFAVLLPGADAAATDRAALRFRTVLEDASLLDGLTASVGHAHSDAAGHDREQLISLADRTMYGAKNRRRQTDADPVPS